LASFAAGLATAEADGWETGARDIATRAYEARKFLFADRIIHWAVPWLDTMGRAHDSHRETAHSDRDILLAFAGEMRVAPLTPGREGLHIEGEDSFGPLDHNQRNLPDWIRSVWSGEIVSRTDSSSDLVGLFEDAASRWSQLASDHPGSAQLWVDLSGRAARTSQFLRTR
jgi:hypothetical protein